MKKLFSLLLILTMICFGAALAEGTESPVSADPAPIQGAIEGGAYFIKIPVSPEETGDWKADEADPEGKVIRLESAELKDDVFTAVYAPTGDGEGTVSLRHYNGPACDRMLSYTLLVSEGSVREVTSGGYAEAPHEEELDPLLAGAWLEDETQFTSMTLTRNPEKGWDAVITSPLTHGAYVFRAVILPDCVTDALVYDGGEWRDLMADGSEAAEPAAAGTIGQLAIGLKGEICTLTWTDSRNPDAAPVVFVRAE